MNIMNLIQQHPLLYADLKSLGLATTTIRELADTLSVQLGGRPDFNLCFVLTALDSRDFVHSIDIAEVSKKMGLAPSIVQSAVLTMAPWVDRFRLVQQVS